MAGSLLSVAAVVPDTAACQAAGPGILGCYHRAGLRTWDRVGVKTKSLKQLLRQQLYPRLGAKVASSKGLHG